MVRSMFNQVQQQKNDSKLSLNKPKQKDHSILNVKDKTLRKKRSEEYMRAMQSLDAGGGVQSLPQEVYDAINNEFPEIDLGGTMIGIIAKCYLGDPYEVHTLNYALQIVKHIERGEQAPDGMDKGRALANNTRYEFVEVYTDRCCAVDSDGNVSVVMD